MSEKGYSRGYRKDRERKRSMDTKKKETTENTRLLFSKEVNCGGLVLYIRFSGNFLENDFWSPPQRPPSLLSILYMTIF